MKIILATILVPLFFIFAWIVSSRIGYVNNFKEPSDGVMLPGTPYYFSVQKYTRSGNVFDEFYTTVNLKNKNGGNDFSLNKGSQPEYGEYLTGDYFLLSIKGSNYLIFKYPNNRGSAGGDYITVYKLNADTPTFVDSVLSCSNPKLIGNNLEFITGEHCDFYPLFIPYKETIRVKLE